MTKSFSEKYGALIYIFALILFVTIIVAFTVDAHRDDVFSFTDESEETEEENMCNVGVISLAGDINTMSTFENVDSFTIAEGIRDLVGQEGHVAVVILIDSFGGTTAAAEEISNAVEEISVPNVTFVRGAALSGAYWIASTTDYIVSLSTSIIGSIGVTSSYFEQTAFNKKEGLEYHEIVSGTFKEVGNANKPLAEEQRDYLQQHVDGAFDIFANVVKANRTLSDDQLARVSDGKFYLAAQAKEYGLIDEVGGMREVKNYLASQTELSAEELSLCEPEDFYYDEEFDEDAEEEFDI